MFNRFAIFTVCLLYSTICEADFTHDLNSGWNFRQAFQPSDYLPATVPGTIHTDLYSNGIIPDPFFGTNETKLQWIETKTWEYTMSFGCTKAMRKEKHIELQFEGLDTYADVYLNDTLLFTSEDMFLSYAKDVKKYIKEKNTLRIVFHPATELIEKNRKLSSIKNYPGGDRVFIRKAQYHFGWDWGPRFVTCGIWKPVHLVGWSDFRVDNVQFTLDKLENDTAFMVCEYHMIVDKPGKFTYVLSADNIEYSRTTDVMDKGDYGCFFLFKIPHPRLWWCNGLGKQDLYEFDFTVTRKKKTVTNTVVTGVRRIELSTDTTGDPTSFFFSINGVPVFAQGANWIPSDNFLPRVRNEIVGAQLSDMRDLNMNMIRVWGGGIYESDYFYSKCDSLGLLVWQDLPFACGMYPISVLNMNSALTMEISDNFNRIYSHPSLAAICGDNENTEGWFNWGWQKELGYSSKDSAFVYNEYKQFHRDIQHTFAYTPFIPSSPANGWGRKEAYTEGDVHYWGVWWGMEPLSSYNTHTGRFVSEFGMQGIPSIHSVNEMGGKPGEQGWWFTDSTIAAHQKHPTGFKTLDAYMMMEYGFVPKKFEDYLYLSQVLQRDALSTAIEAQRRNSPTCMGSLFWQYNDCWPVTSWSVQDYYGRKKLAWYELKRLFAPLLISFEETQDSVHVWITNGSPAPANGNLIVNWTAFYGEIKSSDTITVALNPFENKKCPGISKTKIFHLLPKEQGVMNATFIDNTSNVYRELAASNHCFVKGAALSLSSGEPDYHFVRYITQGPMILRISSKYYLQNVMITCDDPGTTFSRNGFDILSYQMVQVEVYTTKTEKEIRESLKFTSMNELVNNEITPPEMKEED